MEKGRCVKKRMETERLKEENGERKEWKNEELREKVG